MTARHHGASADAAPFAELMGEVLAGLGDVGARGLPVRSAAPAGQAGQPGRDHAPPGVPDWIQSGGRGSVSPADVPDGQ
jgi:hypothetical protein